MESLRRLVRLVGGDLGDHLDAPQRLDHVRAGAPQVGKVQVGDGEPAAIVGRAVVLQHPVFQGQDGRGGRGAAVLSLAAVGRRPHAGERGRGSRPPWGALDAAGVVPGVPAGASASSGENPTNCRIRSPVEPGPAAGEEVRLQRRCDALGLLGDLADRGAGDGGGGFQAAGGVDAGDVQCRQGGLQLRGADGVQLAAA